MMFSRHVSDRLAAYLDGQLSIADRNSVEWHLPRCARCRAELEEIRFAAELLRRVPVVQAPDLVWRSIEGALAAQPGPAARGPGLLVWASCAALLVVAAVVSYRFATRPDVADGKGVIAWNGPATPRRDGLIDTSGSNVTMTIPIGTVEITRGSRVRMVAGPSPWRIALDRGSISAVIDAPPRLFFVETPTSTVVDLGCAYTMHVDEAGGGELRVTKGWASLEWNGRESLVPAGAMGRTRPGADPGTPFFEDSTARLQQALDRFDFADGGVTALDTVLAEARVRDTLTLWHLMWKVEGGDRMRVFDRIAALTPPPPDVSRDKALQLDAATLKHWREELAWTW